MDKEEQEYADKWVALSGGARATLKCLCVKGPTYDGDVPSKSGRDELLTLGMAAKVVMENNEQGYQAATYLGSAVYRCGVVEPRQDTVRRLVGTEHIKTNRRV